MQPCSSWITLHSMIIEENHQGEGAFLRLSTSFDKSVCYEVLSLTCLTINKASWIQGRVATRCLVSLTVGSLTITISECCFVVALFSALYFYYRIVPGKRPWALTAQAPQKYRVGRYMKEVLEWSHYLCASVHPGCKVSGQVIQNRPASSLCPCFVQASPMENAGKRTDLQLHCQASAMFISCST